MLSRFLFLCLPPLKLCRRDRRADGRTGGRTEDLLPLFCLFSPCSPLPPLRLKPCPSCLPAQVQQHTSSGWLLNPNNLMLSGTSYCFVFFLEFAVIILILFCSVGLHETLALLTSQLHPDTNHKEDLVFLKDVFSEKSLSYIMKVDDLSCPRSPDHWLNLQLCEVTFTAIKRCSCKRGTLLSVTKSIFMHDNAPSCCKNIATNPSASALWAQPS